MWVVPHIIPHIYEWGLPPGPISHGPQGKIKNPLVEYQYITRSTTRT
jgi:hypothetical protein